MYLYHWAGEKNSLEVWNLSQLRNALSGVGCWKRVKRRLIKKLPRECCHSWQPPSRLAPSSSSRIPLPSTSTWSSEQRLCCVISPTREKVSFGPFPLSQGGDQTAGQRQQCEVFWPWPGPSPQGWAALGLALRGRGGHGDPGAVSHWSTSCLPRRLNKSFGEECDFAADPCDEASSLWVRRWAYKYSPSPPLFISLASSCPISPADGFPFAARVGAPQPHSPDGSLCNNSLVSVNLHGACASRLPPLLTLPCGQPPPTSPSSPTDLSLVSRNHGQETVALLVDFMLRA